MAAAPPPTKYDVLELPSRLADHQHRSKAAASGAATKESFVNENGKAVVVSAGTKGPNVHLTIAGPDSTGEWEITPMEAGAVRRVLGAIGIQ